MGLASETAGQQIGDDACNSIKCAVGSALPPAAPSSKSPWFDVASSRTTGGSDEVMLREEGEWTRAGWAGAGAGESATVASQYRAELTSEESED